MSVVLYLHRLCDKIHPIRHIMQELSKKILQKILRGGDFCNFTVLTNYLLHYEEVFTFIFGNYDDYPISLCRNLKHQSLSNGPTKSLQN